MKLAAVKTAIVTTANRVGLKVGKHSPEILLGVGVVSVVAGTVVACKQTIKAQDVVAAYENDRDLIERASELSEEYTEDDAKKDKVTLLARTSWSFVKVYSPAAGLMVGGIICILASYNILHKRNVALMAAYEAIDTAFKDYRKRVKEELGDEMDKHFMFGTKAQQIEAEAKEDEEQKEVMPLVNGLQPSIYAKWFDESSTEWTKNAEINLMNIINRQNWANDLLNSRGHVFLNDVYDMLGIPRTSAGAIVGWVKNNPNGDGYIDFGIYRVDRPGQPSAQDFVNGVERSILLDFNVDGVIYDMI